MLRLALIQFRAIWNRTKNTMDVLLAVLQTVLQMANLKSMEIRIHFLKIMGSIVCMGVSQASTIKFGIAELPINLM
ncbi:hypothetical protein D3C71_1065310 [compost metagenome]